MPQAAEGQHGRGRCKRSDCYCSEGIIAECFGLGRNSPAAAAGSRGAAKGDKRRGTQYKLVVRTDFFK
jgi:hypothetical protein